jgi:hypothetical protein
MGALPASYFRIHFSNSQFTIIARFSEAIPGNKGELDCFVASAPRNDVDNSRRDSAFSQRECARVMHSHIAPQGKEGAGAPQEREQGMPGARCTHGFVQKSTR